jgi:hypothetical protein
MQIDRKVVEQALDYIDKVDYGPYDNRSIITALKAALAQPEDKSQAAFEHWVETVEATQGCAISRNAVADAVPIIQPEIKGHNAEPPPEAQTEAEKIAYCAGWWAAMEAKREQEPELRELLISAAAIAVAAERNGAYQGASWVADAVLAQQGKGTSPQEQADPDRVPVKRSGMQALSKALGHPTQISAKDGDTVDDALIELAVSRLEQAEQAEPMALQKLLHQVIYGDFNADNTDDLKLALAARKDFEALQPRHEWQSLSEEEMKDLWAAHGYKSAMCKPFARALENKLRAKNSMPSKKRTVTYVCPVCAASLERQE